MESKIKISYPDSEKIYMYGEIYPDVKVGMRKVNLTPTVTVENGKQVITENAPVYVYDTSGAYSDPAVKNDLKKGLPRLRHNEAVPGKNWLPGYPDVLCKAGNHHPGNGVCCYS